MSQDDFAALIGTTQRTLSRYESDETDLKAPVMAKLAQLGFDAQWLLTGEASPTQTNLRSSPSQIQVPLFNARFSAGRGRFAPDSENCHWVELPEEWIRRATGRNPRNLVMAQAEGNSMEPTIVDGDEMLIDITDKRLSNGKIYALSVSDALVVKRIHLSVSGIVRLISDNRDYEPEEISHTVSAEMQVIGQVVWWSHRAR